MTGLESRQQDRPRRRRLLQVSIAGVLLLSVVTYAASTPILTAIGGLLVHADPLERVDAMIVLAPTLDRILEAADLYRGGHAPLVLVTRERRGAAEQLLIDRGLVESGEDRRRQLLHALGAPLESIVVLDGFASSTAEEAMRFADWARGRPVRSVLVVTSPEHTARARLTFVRAVRNLPVKVIVHPSTLTQFRPDTWWHSRSTLREGVLELQKLLYYRLVELPRLVPPGPA